MRREAHLPASAGGAARRGRGFLLFSFAVAAVAALVLCGCVYKGGKIVEGTDFSAGVSIPGTEGCAEVSFVNYLSGFRFGVDRNCGLECEYHGTNYFSFAWGLYESRNSKHFTATVTPCEVVGTNAVEAAEGEPK